MLRQVKVTAVEGFHTIASEFEMITATTSAYAEEIAFITELNIGLKRDVVRISGENAALQTQTHLLNLQVGNLDSLVGELLEFVRDKQDSISELFDEIANAGRFSVSDGCARKLLEDFTTVNQQFVGMPPSKHKPRERKSLSGDHMEGYEYGRGMTSDTDGRILRRGSGVPSADFEANDSSKWFNYC